MTLPTNVDFATEVKSDRLKILARFTLFACGVVLVFLAAFGLSGAMAATAALGLFIGSVILIVACSVTDYLLRRGQLQYAAWAFAIGAMLAVAVLMWEGDTVALQTLPFVFPLIIFIIGLLLAPPNTFLVALVASALVVVLPGTAGGAGIELSVQQAMAVALNFLSALLATQVTGELYQITEWALMNYRNEREMNSELFEKRQELQFSLKRSEALADKLQDANAELEEARAAAEEAKNFRGQFLANMSHELRTPLNAIIGFSETMLQFPIMYDNETLPHAYEQDLSKIYESGQQLLHVINDILDLAKVDAGKLEIRMQRVSPKPILLAVLSTTKGLIGTKPIRLEDDFPDPMPEVWADETRLRQVLLNLLSNAAKYTDEGSICLRVRALGEEVEFSVQDTGVGIAPQFHERLFQEFEQAQHVGRDPRAGSGLGLAITRQLLDLMGGRVWMESELGVGSTFYFVVATYQGQDQQNQPPLVVPAPIESTIVTQTEGQA